MKKILFFIGFLQAILAFAQISDPLWQKAMTIAEKNAQYIPGKTIYQTDIKNPKDSKDNSTIFVILKHQKKETDTIETTIIEAKKDNKPMTEEERKEIDKLTERDLKPKKEGIFFTKDPKKLKVKANNLQKQINGMTCKGYEFEFKNQDEKGKEQILQGIAWLEENSGAPLLMKFSMKKLPMFVKDLEIENLFYFNKKTEQWYSLKLTTSVDISVMLKKIKSVTEMKFSEYWEY